MHKERGLLREAPRNGVSTAKHHHTARDVVSRWDVVEAHSQATAATAAQVKSQESGAEAALPPQGAIRLWRNGGSEFAASFEAECQRRGIRLFVLPPHSPKPSALRASARRLNGHVERAHRTHTEEFCEVYSGHLEITPLNQTLLAWERTYNTIRPHQALNYLTPPTISATILTGKGGDMSLMYWTRRFCCF